ncbi:MAG: hypothetical protein GSR86_07610 [Desulfurococcales archaeon]|nr:hypothetical protein [Desulfurococcales archaeon]
MDALEVLAVQGSSILKTLLTGPLSIGVLVLVWVVAAIYTLARRGSRARRMMAVAMAVTATIIVVGAQAYSIQPGVEYGIYLEEDKILVRFYMDDEVEYNLCNTRIEVLDRDKALEMIKIRTNGVYDPSTGVAAGYFKTHDGLDAYIIISGKSIDKVIVLRGDNGVAIIGLPGVEEAYNKLEKAREDLCS